MDEIFAGARKLCPEIPGGAAITEFAGLRAASSTGDFVLGKSKVEGLLQAAGIQSPGLTSAPAIAQYIAEIIVGETGAEKRGDYKKGRPEEPVFRELDDEAKAALIKKDSRYGRIICRCETITEGEIVDAINRPCGARTVDGVKRRTRAGMGRCQGGFCQAKVLEILARELGKDETEITLKGKGSQILKDRTRQVEK
jgi:glycerol-3-phosphate dehydrogenase